MYKIKKKNNILFLICYKDYLYYYQFELFLICGFCLTKNNYYNNSGSSNNYCKFYNNFELTSIKLCYAWNMKCMISEIWYFHNK